MKDMPVPYFYTNEEWFYYDEKEEMYKLTSEAPEEAIRSYYRFYSKELFDSKYGIIGLAIGDAMGVPIEFCAREKTIKNPTTEMKGYGTYDVPKGSWSDDTSMTLCLIDAINKSGEIIPEDIATNFVKWLDNAEFTSVDRTFDVGNTCLMAINNYKKGSKATESGLDFIDCNGNGSLMRILPLAYYCYAKELDDNEIYNLVKDVSSITHRHEISIMGCYIYVLYAIQLLSGESLKSAYHNIQEKDYSMFSDECRLRYNRIIKDEIFKYDIDDIKSSGYVVDTLEATLWTLLTTDDFNSAIIKAINLGEDTDTVGACTGGLAGIYYGMQYGLDCINENWKRDLLKYDYIEKMCDDFNNILEEGICY